MLTGRQVQQARERAAATLEAAGLKLTPEEREGIEVVDFARNVLEDVGAQIVVYVNTERFCAKEIVLFPNQTCAEHRHPPFDGTPGKEETFRVRRGTRRRARHGQTGAGTRPRARSFSTRRAVHGAAGTRSTGFRPGPEGAIVSEFSTRSREDLDVFTDPEMARATVVAPEQPRPNSAP